MSAPAVCFGSLFKHVCSLSSLKAFSIPSSTSLSDVLLLVSAANGLACLFQFLLREKWSRLLDLQSELGHKQQAVDHLQQQFENIRETLGELQQKAESAIFAVNENAEHLQEEKGIQENVELHRGAVALEQTAVRAVHESPESQQEFIAAFAHLKSVTDETIHARQEAVAAVGLVAGAAARRRLSPWCSGR